MYSGTEAAPQSGLRQAGDLAPPTGTSGVDAGSRQMLVDSIDMQLADMSPMQDGGTPCVLVFGTAHRRSIWPRLEYYFVMLTQKGVVPLLCGFSGSWSACRSDVNQRQTARF